MKRPGVALALGAAALLVCTLVPELRAEPQVTRVTLGNGLRVVLAPDSLATAADVAVWYASGVRNEKPGVSGMTRLFERLMFRGSAAVPDGEHRRRIYREGGVSNVTTTADYSCFWETVPGEAVGTALWLEADRMAGIRPTAAALAEERRAVVEDRRGAAQRAPVPHGLTLLYQTVFANEPYGRPLLGSGAELDKVTLRDIEAWRRERYAPANAVLTVVGRFEPQATLALIRKLFEPLPKGSAPRNASLGEPHGPQRTSETMDTPARLLFVGWRGPGAADPDAPVLEVIARLLGTGGRARLPQALVSDWKAAYLAQSGCNVHRDASLLWTLAVVGANADSAIAEHILLDEVGRLSHEPVGDDELSAACRGLETATLFAQQAARARAQSLGEAELFAGDAGRADARLAGLRRITPSDVQRVAQRILTDSARGVVWISPQSSAAPGGEK